MLTLLWFTCSQEQRPSWFYWKYEYSVFARLSQDSQHCSIILIYNILIYTLHTQCMLSTNQGAVQYSEVPIVRSPRVRRPNTAIVQKVNQHCLLWQGSKTSYISYFFLYFNRIPINLLFFQINSYISYISAIFSV